MLKNIFTEYFLIINESVSYKGVCRAAPATPGLLETKSPLLVNNKSVQNSIL